MRMVARFFSLALLAGGLCPGLLARAQVPDPQAQLARQDEQMIQAGWQVMHLIDVGQIALVWDAASPVMKQRISREVFIAQLTDRRAQLGAVVERQRPEVTRSHSDGSGGVPEGFYINVVAKTRFSHQSEPVSEFVTFRFDEDQAWRVTGYSMH